MRISALGLIIATLPCLAQTPPPGTGLLELTITRASEGTKSSSVLSFLVPIDGKPHEFGSGRQLPVQTRVNMVITVIYIDATTRLAGTLIPHTSGTSQYIAMTGSVIETHVLQQLGIPFALAEAALLDTTQCQGAWLLTNGGSRPICSWSRRGTNPVEWDASVKLVWQEKGLAGRPLEPKQTFTTEATTRIATGASERLQSISCDAISGSPIRCESMHGRQVPLLTQSAETKTTSYGDVTTNITMSIGADGQTSVRMQDRGLDPPSDITRIDFTQLRSTHGEYDVPGSTMAIDGLTVTRFGKSGEGDVTVNLERYRRIIPAIGLR